MLIDTHCHYLPQALLSALMQRRAYPRVTGAGTAFGASTPPAGNAAPAGGATTGVEAANGPNAAIDASTVAAGNAEPGASAGLTMEYGVHCAPGPITPKLTDIDVILAEMDDARIDHSVLSVTIPGVDWLEPADAAAVAHACNAETAAHCAAHPDRLSGLAVVPLQAPDEAVAVLRAAVALGCKGAMVYSNVAGDHLDTPARRRFFDAAAELHLPIMLHPTYPLCAPTVAAYGLVEIAGFLFDTTTATLRLICDGLYERHPDFKLIVPHVGSLTPYFAGRIDYFARARPSFAGGLAERIDEHLRKLLIDTACFSPPALKLALDFFGVEQVMFGSDHPFWPMALAGDVLDALDLSAADRAKIEHENAMRLLAIAIETSPRGGLDESPSTLTG